MIILRRESADRDYLVGMSCPALMLFFRSAGGVRIGRRGVSIGIAMGDLLQMEIQHTAGHIMHARRWTALITRSR